MLSSSQQVTISVSSATSGCVSGSASNRTVQEATLTEEKRERCIRGRQEKRQLSAQGSWAKKSWCNLIQFSPMKEELNLASTRVQAHVGWRSVCFKNRIYNRAGDHSAVGFSGRGNSSVVLADGVQKTTQGGRTLSPPGRVSKPTVHSPHPATGRASPRLSHIVIDSFNKVLCIMT